MSRAPGLEGAVLAAAALEYAANHLWLRQAAGGAVRLFLVCWCNDLFAGAAILAWANLLLSLGRLPLLDRPLRALPFVLGCGLVWELAAPLWKPGAVCDPWDLAAYLAGALLYLAVRWGWVTWSRKAASLSCKMKPSFPTSPRKEESL